MIPNLSRFNANGFALHRYEDGRLMMVKREGDELQAITNATDTIIRAFEDEELIIKCRHSFVAAKSGYQCKICNERRIMVKFFEMEEYQEVEKMLCPARVAADKALYKEQLTIALRYLLQAKYENIDSVISFLRERIKDG